MPNQAYLPRSIRVQTAVEMKARGEAAEAVSKPLKVEVALLRKELRKCESDQSGVAEAVERREGRRHSQVTAAAVR